MFAFVKVLEDAREADLIFADKSHAEHFTRFVHTYIAESGAGNGYGAYWHFGDVPTVGVDTKIGKGELRADLIRDMAIGICDARKAHPHAWEDGIYKLPEYIPSFASVNGLILFHFDPNKLPPRLTPEIEDLVRIVDNPAYDRVIARVKEVRAENMILKPCPYGIKESVKLPTMNVMKIHDFLRGE